jgi:hypothetical protein
MKYALLALLLCAGGRCLAQSALPKSAPGTLPAERQYVETMAVAVRLTPATLDSLIQARAGQPERMAPALPTGRQYQVVETTAVPVPHAVLSTGPRTIDPPQLPNGRTMVEINVEAVPLRSRAEVLTAPR